MCGPCCGPIAETIPDLSLEEARLVQHTLCITSHMVDRLEVPGRHLNPLPHRLKMTPPHLTRVALVTGAAISGMRAGTGRMAYGTSKAALIAMTRQFAVEVAQWGVTVNAIAPGPVDTPLVLANHSGSTRSTYGDMVPMRRYGTPEE